MSEEKPAEIVGAEDLSETEHGEPSTGQADEVLSLTYDDGVQEPPDDQEEETVSILESESGEQFHAEVSEEEFTGISLNADLIESISSASSGQPEADPTDEVDETGEDEEEETGEVDETGEEEEETGEVDQTGEEEEEETGDVDQTGEEEETGEVDEADEEEEGEEDEEEEENEEAEEVHLKLDPEEPDVYATPDRTSSFQFEIEPPTDSMPPDEPDEVPTQLGPSCPRVPPLPELFSDKEAPQELEESKLTNVLNLVWSFGQSRSIPVINMTTDRVNAIFYICGHTGVIYDIASNRQTLLQGHSADISCSCASANKRWIVTADKGSDSLVIVWDSTSAIPVRTIFDAHPDGGVASVALTPDGRYLATLSSAKMQTLAIWDWTTESEIPICTAEISSLGHQNYIQFFQGDYTQMATNSESQVIFYSWRGGVFEYFAPPLADEVLNKPIGKFIQTVYLTGSTRAMTSTSIGNIVIWETHKPASAKYHEKPADKRALKIIRVVDVAINVLVPAENYVMAGDSHGHIRVFDEYLQLVNWYQDLNLGSINSLSFAYSAEPLSSENGHHYPEQSTLAASPFVIRDFVIGTNTGIHASVEVAGTNIKIIHRDFDSSVTALATHPTLPILAAGCSTGLINLWQYKKRIVIMSRSFDGEQSIRCCAFDPAGQILAISVGNGAIRLVDAVSLEDIAPPNLRITDDAITHIAFSHDSQFLAMADVGCAVTVLRKNDNRKMPFSHLGRHRAHYKTIKDLCFGVARDTKEPRLLSLGDDRLLVEYDLGKSSLFVLSLDRIEQSAVPLCLMWYPPLSKECFFMTANDQFKFKLYNSTTKMCRKTVLGPTYGSHVQKMALIPATSETQEKRYMAYAIQDKVGLIILPVDGNPHNSSAVIAHPRGISNISASNDGRYLFTSGGVDNSIHMWAISISALEAQAALGGEDLVPFYGLLDGGKEGPVFTELQDLFYYSQTRSQGVDTMDMKELQNVVAISEIPFIMRALGFYPTEHEIELMLNEVKFGNYVKTGKQTTEIDLGTLLQLYVNHRPAFGLDIAKIRWAFEVLGSKIGDTYAIDRERLLELLQNYGEPMTQQELDDYLSTLEGLLPEGGSCEYQKLGLREVRGDSLESKLPQTVTVEMFVEQLLELKGSAPTPPPEKISTEVLTQSSESTASIRTSFRSNASSFIPTVRYSTTSSKRPSDVSVISGRRSLRPSDSSSKQTRHSNVSSGGSLRP